MARTLCDRKRTLNQDATEYARLVRKPRYLCLECGRSARKKKYLCKPGRIADLLADPET